MSLFKPSTNAHRSVCETTRKILHKQARNIIYCVHSFSNSCQLQKFSNVQISPRVTNSVTNIVKEGKQFTKLGEVSIFRSPGKHRAVKKRVTNLNDFQKYVLRRTIHDLYDKSEYPTAKKLTNLMREK